MLLATSARTSKGVLLALALALILPACSGGDSGGRGESSESDQAVGSSSSDQTGTNIPPALAIEPAAQARAKSILLTRSDLSGGWQTARGGVGVILACGGGDYSALTLIGNARGDDFEDSVGSRVSSHAQVFATEKMAEEQFEILADEVERDEVEQCVVDGLRRAPTAPETEVSIREISIPPPSGIDKARAWQAAITYPDDYLVHDETFVLHDGDTTGFVLTWSLLSPFNPVLRNELIATVASRMSD